MNVFSCIFNLSDYKNAYGRYHQVLLEQGELVGDLSQFRISTEDHYIGVSFPAVLFDKYNYKLVNSIIHELTLKWDKMKLDEETIKSRFCDIETIEKDAYGVLSVVRHRKTKHPIYWTQIIVSPVNRINVVQVEI